MTAERLRWLCPGLEGSDYLRIEDLADAAGQPTGTRVTLRIPLEPDRVSGVEDAG